jgi:hypothetical protein
VAQAAWLQPAEVDHTETLFSVAKVQRVTLTDFFRRFFLAFIFPPILPLAFLWES